jgi:hypothetical protein
MDWAARDTAAQSTDSRMTTSVWWTATNHIPSCRGGLRQSTSYGQTQLRTPKIQKSELTDQALALLIYYNSLSFSSGHLGRHVYNFPLSHVSNPARGHELAHQVVINREPKGNHGGRTV